MAKQKTSHAQDCYSLISWIATDYNEWPRELHKSPSPLFPNVVGAAVSISSFLSHSTPRSKGGQPAPFSCLTLKEHVLQLRMLQWHSTAAMV